MQVDKFYLSTLLALALFIDLHFFIATIHSTSMLHTSGSVCNLNVHSCACAFENKKEDACQLVEKKMNEEIKKERTCWTW